MIYQPRKGKTFLFERLVGVQVINYRADYRMRCVVLCLCSSDWERWRIIKQLGEITIENLFPHIFPRKPEYIWGKPICDTLQEKDRLN